MKAYTKLRKRKKEESERLRGEGDQMKLQDSGKDERGKCSINCAFLGRMLIRRMHH